MTGGFAESLKGEEEVRISFVRKNGKKRTIPIWFALDGNELELLPMYGLKTKWFADVESSGKLEVRTIKMAKSAEPRIVRDKDAVERIKEKFAAKYGESDVRRYYPTSEVAIVIQV